MEQEWIGKGEVGGLEEVEGNLVKMHCMREESMFNNNKRNGKSILSEVCCMEFYRLLLIVCLLRRSAPD